MIPCSHPLGRRWYLVRTVRHGEPDAVRAIEALGLEAYMPRERHFAKYGRTIKPVTAPLFRQYVFTRFDVERDEWSGIRRAQSVDDIVSANEIPLWMPDAEVNLIRQCEHRGDYDLTRKGTVTGDYLLPGTPVRITNGPFVGHLGQVAHLAPRHRVAVLLGKLGRITMEKLHLAKA